MKWLWQQYNKNKYSTHSLVVVWLYQRYNYKKPKKNPLKASHHTLPQNLLDSITKTFNVTHSYFSSLVTCSTHITQYYSPFARDKIFGALGTAFQYKWNGIGHAHPHNEETTHQAIHWAKISSQERLKYHHTFSHTRH